MALLMDAHTLEGGVSARDVATAHQADLATQGAYGVSYERHWVDEAAGKISSASSTRRMQRPPTQCTARPTGSSPTRSTRSPRAPEALRRAPQASAAPATSRRSKVTRQRREIVRAAAFGDARPPFPVSHRSSSGKATPMERYTR